MKMRADMGTIVAAASLAIMALAAWADTTFSGTLFCRTTWEHVKTVGAAELTETVPDFFTWTHADGDTTNQMNAFVSAPISLAAGATNAINLAAAVNGFGDTVNFSKVKFLAFGAAVSNEAALRVGGAEADAFAGCFGDASDTVDVRPGGFVMLAAPDAAGYTVGTGTNLWVVNTGTNAAIGTAYIGGVQ